MASYNSTARLPDQFDAELHCDHTRAVEPLNGARNGKWAKWTRPSPAAIQFGLVHLHLGSVRLPMFKMKILAHPGLNGSNSGTSRAAKAWMEFPNPRAAREKNRTECSVVKHLDHYLLLAVGNATLVPSAAGAVLHVSTNGHDVLSGANWTQAKRTIANAVSTANAGDAIWIAAGRYAQRV